jgi:hypothetical protein
VLVPMSITARRIDGLYTARRASATARPAGRADRLPRSRQDHAGQSRDRRAGRGRRRRRRQAGDRRQRARHDRHRRRSVAGRRRAPGRAARRLRLLRAGRRSRSHDPRDPRQQPRGRHPLARDHRRRRAGADRVDPGAPAARRAGPGRGDRHGDRSAVVACGPRDLVGGGDPARERGRGAGDQARPRVRRRGGGGVRGGGALAPHAPVVATSADAAAAWLLATLRDPPERAAVEADPTAHDHAAHEHATITRRHGVDAVALPIDRRPRHRGVRGRGRGAAAERTSG